MDADLIAALTGVVAAIVAVVAVVVESRRSRFALGIETLLMFEDRFDSEKMRGLRQRAAQELKGRIPGYALSEVLSFFETIGLLVERRALDTHMVWSSFYAKFHCYVHAARNYIDSTRETDETIWRYVMMLDDRLTIIDMKERLLGTRNLPSPIEMAEFLDSELHLTGSNDSTY